MLEADSTGAAPAEAERSEPASDDNPQDLLRRRYRELLEELRTVLPGVQVLLAFLLVAPFSARFAELDQLGRIAFTGALLGVAAASVLLFAPTAYHRLSDRHGRERRLTVSIRFQVAGMMVVGVAIADAVFVITRFLFGTATGLASGGLILAMTLSLWLVLPIGGQRRGD